MSELNHDPRWNQEACRVASELDRNDTYRAQDHLRQDLYQLQNDPRAQHEFLNMVNRYDRKGMGADLNIYRDQYGREQWQISSPYGGDGRYYPQPMPMPMPVPEVPVPVPVPVPYPNRPVNPGEAIIDGIATGVGVGLGREIIRDIFRGGDNHHRR